MDEIERMVREFRLAVYQDCLGWFLARWKMDEMEFRAKTSLELIAMAATEINARREAVKEQDRQDEIGRN